KPFRQRANFFGGLDFVPGATKLVEQPDRRPPLSVRQVTLANQPSERASRFHGRAPPDDHSPNVAKELPAMTDRGLRAAQRHNRTRIPKSHAQRPSRSSLTASAAVRAVTVARRVFQNDGDRRRSALRNRPAATSATSSADSSSTVSGTIFAIGRWRSRTMISP